MNKRTSPWLLLLASALWGSSFIASKICIASGMQPFEIVFYRFAWGSALTWLLFHKQLRPISKSAFRTGGLLGISTSIAFTFEMFGLTMTEASKASFLAATHIIILPLLYALYYRVRLGTASVLAAGLAAFGVGVISLSSGFGSLAWGDLLMLASAFMCAVNSMIVTVLGKDDSGLQISFVQFMTTAVIMGCLTLLQGIGTNHPLSAYAGAAFLSVFPTVVCYLIKNIAMQRLDPVQCTLILSTESIFCTCFSVLLLGDTFTMRLFIGALFIGCAIVIAILYPTQRCTKPFSMKCHTAEQMSEQ